MSGGKMMSVLSEALSVSAGASLDAAAGQASVSVLEDLTVVSGGVVSVSSASVDLSSSGAVSVLSGSSVSLYAM